MTISLVLTVTSQDRPGLVELLSQVVVEHEGNWLESRLSRLAGRFAGIVLVSVAEANSQALIRSLKVLQTRGLTVTVEQGEGMFVKGDYHTLALELIGQDHPGIIHDISHALGSQGITVEELTTECVSGSMSGENLFKAAASLRVPRTLSSEVLRASLEGLADELMVDITLEDIPTIHV